MIKCKHKQKEKDRKKMERYTFSGFTFGNDGFVLQICVNNADQSRTEYSTKVEFELTEAERVALITYLITLK
jgi:hypothetical protein